ncbi:cytochrome P450 307a1-like [Trichogramma pretiosum]|uniref:cytochrome P450 307a1-like n=1 Tax=Trichogramma pretiosum TaxID=7493 RepID=UPI0006C96652|nr:cytochrome P450 307a1-like [Trichogramma pretiosum]XP_023316120.1 cytochrome P450 307a1-like [Trichogramma pretiosum]
MTMTDPMDELYGVFCVIVAMVVFACAAIGCKTYKNYKKRSTDLADLVEVKIPMDELAGPRGFPIIGALHQLSDSGGPFEAFTRLSQMYGEMYAIQLGSAKCVVVSNIALAKEVLITRGFDFGGRPDFLRFHSLFGGDRNNSLALCDWSSLQKRRRSIARVFCFPRQGGNHMTALSDVSIQEMNSCLDYLCKESTRPIIEGREPFKPIIMRTIANIFTNYMCSMSFGYDDAKFNEIVTTFDKIFWDINQGYALDFLPWLKPFYKKHLDTLNDWASTIRSFLLERIINKKYEKLQNGGKPSDFTETLLEHHLSPESDLTWEHIMFELEDFIGGHSAVGNLLTMIFVYLAKNPEAQRKIYDEVERLKFGKRQREDYVVSLYDREELPYTEAVMWETLRMSSSPIVPHVAITDTSLGNCTIDKGTCVFINNYELNLGTSYWGDDAREFKPERFIRSVKDERGNSKDCPVKPAHFLPFSTGKRTCIGQRLVQSISFVFLSNFVWKYELQVPDGQDPMDYVQPSCVALPPECFNLKFVERHPSRKVPAAKSPQENETPVELSSSVR